MSEIDQAALRTIRAIQRPGSPDLLGRVIGVFVEQTPSCVETIKRACVAGDLETIRTSAHSIKSSSAYLGASQFSTRLAKIEIAARDADLAMCRALIVGLEDHCQDVIDELLAMQDKAA